jgi:hypothetical protein
MPFGNPHLGLDPAANLLVLFLHLPSATKEGSPCRIQGA